MEAFFTGPCRVQLDADFTGFKGTHAGGIEGKSNAFGFSGLHDPCDKGVMARRVRRGCGRIFFEAQGLAHPKDPNLLIFDGDHRLFVVLRDPMGQ